MFVLLTNIYKCTQSGGCDSSASTLLIAVRSVPPARPRAYYLLRMRLEHEGSKRNACIQSRYILSLQFRSLFVLYGKAGISKYTDKHDVSAVVFLEVLSGSAAAGEKIYK